MEEIRKRILVVDDEPGILKILRIKLKTQGYDVVITTSGTEAINLVKTEPLDIMLLDIVMSDVNGLQVLETVRAFSDIPVIAFTANPQMAETAMQMGAVGSIAKPFDAEQLVKKIKSILDGDKKKPGSN